MNIKETLKKVRSKISSELKENFGVGERGMGDLGRFGQRAALRAEKIAQPIARFSGVETLGKSLGAAIGTRSPSDMASMRRNAGSALQGAATIAGFGLAAPASLVGRVAAGSALGGAGGLGAGLDSNKDRKGIAKSALVGAGIGGGLPIAGAMVGNAVKSAQNVARNARGGKVLPPGGVRLAKGIPNVEIEDFVKKQPTNVKDKVNVVDYLRTPDRVLKKMGLEKESGAIRKGYESYQKELPTHIDQISKWAQNTTPEENTNIFRALDGQGVQLNPKEAQIAGEVKTYLEAWADRLKLPKENRISNYITHIFDKELGGKEFDDDLAKIITDQVAGSVYDPFTQRRLGKLGYVEDTWRALDAYVKRGTRKVNMDPALEQVKDASKNLELSQLNYVKKYVDRINMRPTEIDNLTDNWIKSVAGYKFGQRPTAEISQKARQWVYRGTLGLNPGSALKNLSQGANTYAKLGEKYTLSGYAQAMKSLATGGDELQRVGVLSDDIIQDRNLTFAKNAVQKLDKGLFSLFDTAEKINRGAAYFGAKSKAIAKGLPEDQAIEYAKKIVRDTQFTFGSIDTPPVLQGDFNKTLLQFQSYSIKQGEFLGEMLAAKDLAGIARWTGASLLFISTIGKAIGMQPKDLVPSLRIGGSPIFGLGKELAGAATGARDDFGNEVSPVERVKKIGSSLIPLIPGGVQAKKTITGLKTVGHGYAETAAGNVKFPVDQTTGNYIKAGIFGPNNPPEARDYREDKQAPLGASQSEIFKATGGSNFDAVKAERAANKELEKMKQGKKTKAQDLGDGVKQLSDGRYAWIENGEAKTYNPKKYDGSYKSYKTLMGNENVPDAIKKALTSNTPAKLQERYAFEEQKPEIDAEIALIKDRAKRSDNVEQWINAAEMQFNYLSQYRNTLDPKADKVEYLKTTNAIEDILAEAGKYAQYGGFKKPKKAKVRKPKKSAVDPSRVVSVPKITRQRRTSRVKRIVRKPRVTKARLAGLR